MSPLTECLVDLLHRRDVAHGRPPAYFVCRVLPHGASRGLGVARTSDVSRHVTGRARSPRRGWASVSCASLSVLT